MLPMVQIPCSPCSLCSSCCRSKLLYALIVIRNASVDNRRPGLTPCYGVHSRL
nr:AlNc14C107G6272 [Albugo laibachii Nc14]|eukprot:CCA20944.1 AlNc14C107G6272 [Albugo laibachii Nc14]